MGLDVVKRYSKMRLWYDKVLKEENNYKLPLKDKILAIKHGFSSDFFHLYGLNKKNINEYISEYERYLSREIDGEYKIILDNKILFTNFFGKLLNVPEILCIILDCFYDMQGTEISDDKLISILTNEKVIVKPGCGTGGGSGVYLIDYNQEDGFRLDGELISNQKLVEFLKKQKNSIITKFVNQHEYAKNIFANSTNTMRIITIKDVNTGKVIIPFAVHRWGCKKSGPVDNASRGGFITKINVETGIMEKTRNFSENTEWSIHPETNAQIEGINIPNWDYVTNKLIEVASKLPYIPFIAWDILMTENGDFTVIEGNASSGLRILQIFGPIKNSKLGDFYRYYGIIK